MDNSAYWIIRRYKIILLLIIYKKKIKVLFY